MEIIQIVSRLPPAIDGVGDYAFLLAKQLRKTHGVQTTFVVCGAERRAKSEERPQAANSDLRSPASLDGFPVHQLRERSAKELLRVLNQPGMPHTVLLQYVGYGYEKRGCPVWMAKALRAWREGHSARRLVTMFHELYAFGPPWRSSFWTSLAQRWVAQSLASKSDRCFTNRIVSAAWLASKIKYPGVSIPVFPVFSNLGEAANPLPLSSRKPQMILYPNVCRYPNAAILVRHACDKMGIEIVLLFGKREVGASFNIGRNWINVGKPTPDVASHLLSESRVGCLDYFDGYLGKSGIFATYCAHGMAPVLLFNNHSEAEGLKINRHYWAAKSLPETTDVLAQQQIAEQAHGWYGAHTVAVTAQAYAEALIGF